MKAFFHWYYKSQEFILIILFVLMTATILMQVLSRFVLPNPVTWSEEFGKILLMWVTYMGLALSLKYDKHVRIDLIDSYASPKVKKWIDLVFVEIAGLTLAVIMLVFTYSYMDSQMSYGQVTPILRWPMYLILCVFLIGQLLMLIYFLGSIYERTKSMLQEIRKDVIK